MCPSLMRVSLASCTARALGRARNYGLGLARRHASTLVEYHPDAATVYIHWPFCSKICPYCSFNKTLDSPGTNHAGMSAGILSELAALLSATAPVAIQSVYFGGGTPSLAQPALVEQVLSLLASTHAVECAPDMEVTLEVNPAHCSQAERGVAFLGAFASAGVNRCSLGVQSFHAPTLRKLGRDHSPEDAFRAAANCKRVFGERTSIDLMFANPGQTLSEWEADLCAAVEHTDTHMSLYHLSIEKGTLFHKQSVRGELAVPSQDDAADMLDLAVDILHTRSALRRYEVANFAKPGRESRHNLNYWAGNDYIGVGPGAHGRITLRNPEAARRLGLAALLGPPLSGADLVGRRVATVQQRHTAEWMAQVGRAGHATKHAAIQGAYDRASEVLAMGMRAVGGISHVSWARHCQRLFPSGGGLASRLEWLFFGDPAAAGDEASDGGSSAMLRQLRREGMLVCDEAGMRVSARAMHLLDSIMPWLLLRLEKARVWGAAER